MKCIVVLDYIIKFYCVNMYSRVGRLYLLRVQIIVVICVKSSKLIKHVLDLIRNEIIHFFRLAKCQKFNLDGWIVGQGVYLSSIRIESLGNAIQEFSLAQPSWLMSNYALLYK